MHELNNKDSLSNSNEVEFIPRAERVYCAWYRWYDVRARHRRSQDFVLGCAFLLQKVDIFIVVDLKKTLKLPK